MALRQAAGDIDAHLVFEQLVEEGPINPALLVEVRPRARQVLPARQPFRV